MRSPAPLACLEIVRYLKPLGRNEKSLHTQGRSATSLVRRVHLIVQTEVEMDKAVIGIDVSKDHLDVVLLENDLSRRAGFKNSQAGFAKLERWIIHMR